MNDKKTILLVEDEALIAMAQKKTLERHGYGVITVHSGEKAIEKVRTTPDIDLILMDINLGKGKMDGTECAGIILKEKDIPILFLSSYTQPEVVKRTEKISSYGYVVKDSGETVLNTSIKMAFRLYEAHRRLDERGKVLKESEETFRSLLEVITDRKRASDQIEKNEALLQAIIEGTTDAIYVKDLMGRYILFNRAAEHFTGRNREDVLGRDDTFLFPREEAAIVMNGDRRVITEGKLAAYEEIVSTFPGTTSTFFSTKGPIFDKNDNPVGLFGIARDITGRKLLEETLRLDSQIMRNMAEGVYLIRCSDGVIVHANDRFERMFGYDPGELIGQPVAIVNAPSDKLPEEKAKEIIEALNRNGVWEGEVQNIKKDGTTFWCSASVTTFEHASYGTVWISVHRDIADRKRAEQRLKESELRYRGLFESSPDAIILHDGERVLYLNKAAEKLIGSRKKDRIVGRKILDLIHPEDREGMTRDIDSIRQTGGDTTSIKRMKLVRDDEKILHVEYTGSSVDYGGPVLLRMFMRDVTDRVMAEKALAKTRQQQQAILDSIPDMAWLKDRDGRYIRANKPFGEACGVEPEHLPGKTDFDIWPKDLADKYRADDRAVLKSGERRQFEELLTDKDGNTIWIETIKTPVFNDGGETIGTSGIARNITQRKEQEEQLRQYRGMLEQLVEKRTTELLKVNALLEQELSEHKRTEGKVQGLNVELEQRIIELDAANKELEILNYSVSHGLKTPLVAIEGFSRNLMEKHSHNLDAKGRHFLGIINKSTKKMNELIEDLHAFFSVGLKSIKSSTINMEKMTSDIISDLRSILPNDTFTIEFDTLPPAYGDRKMIRQVLINLFGNAIKYSRPKGAAVITVEGRIEEGKSIYSVKDNGVGFSMEHADRIFEVFERLHSPDEFEGTGIGLAIVKRIVHKHGGDVRAEGVVNEGATFCFTLPGSAPLGTRGAVSRA